MNDDSQMISGSIIGLKKEFEEQYITLHKYTFPEVLGRIRKSNISDYSIFLGNSILFSHLVYTGTNYAEDMKAIGSDKITQDWWKLTQPMQEPFRDKKDHEWWSTIQLLFNYENISSTTDAISRQAYTMPVPGGMPKTITDNLFASTNLLTNRNLKSLKLFQGSHELYIYLETNHPFEESSLIENISKVLNSEVSPTAMKEVFHTENKIAKRIVENNKVFVTGCFDLLHSGHLAFLKEAATFGELYVSIGTDENVNQLKGRNPINNQDERKYMIDSLGCVKKCLINSGWGIIDFEKEIQAVNPDVFLVNEDGHTPAKQELCKKIGIEYKILKRIPHTNLPVRSTTTLRTECTIPFRIDLAGGWLDQPFVSKYYPGPVLTISIEPTIEFNDRSGMSSSTRRKAIELWNNKIPQGNPENLARILFSFENPPGTKNVSGSQDSLGIVLPGLNKLDYDGDYWPNKITSELNEDALSWIEEMLYLITLEPRITSYSPLRETNINEDGAKALSHAAEECWDAILKKDIHKFGNSFRKSFEAQIAMFPHMINKDLEQVIDQYKNKALGYKLSGAGGGGYIILVSETPIKGAMKIKIRRKSSL